MSSTLGYTLRLKIGAKLHVGKQSPKNMTSKHGKKTKIGFKTYNLGPLTHEQSPEITITEKFR